MAIQYPPVTLTETVISAGAPNTLQKTVAYVSFGATTLTTGTRKLVTQLTDISGSLTSGSWLLAAFTTFFAQGTASAYVIELGNASSGAQASGTAVLGTQPQYTVSAIAVNAGGTGWTVGETFSFFGGTGTVATVTGGVVATVTLSSSTPELTNPAGTGVAATATSGSGTGLTLNVTATTGSTSNGEVASVTVTSGGSGYSSAPSVTFSGGGGTGAAAVAIISGGAVTAVTVTEFGSGYTSVPTVTIAAPPASPITQITDYLQSYPLQNYLYVIDPSNSQNPAFWTLAAQYDNYTSYTYFLFTVSVSQAATYGSHKGSILFTPAITLPSTEFTASVIAFAFASITFSAVAKIRPFNYRFVTGVTVYAQPGTAALGLALATNTNLVIPATAGGLTQLMLLGGQTSDGNAINLWYGPDYASLTVTQTLANAIIEGSNDSTNPLAYSQAGINTLVARTIQTLNAAVIVDAILGPVTVSAIDFADYVLANPSDYQNGVYNGITFTIVPARGFNAITYGMTVDFTAASVTATAQ